MSIREMNAFINNEEVIAKLRGHYEKAAQRILNELAHGISRPGAARAIQLLRDINKIINTLDPRKDSPVGRWIKNNAEKAYVIGDAAATAKLRADLSVSINSAMGAGATAAMRGIVASLQVSLSGAAADMRRVLGAVVRQTQVTLLQSKQLRDATVSGIIRGASGSQISNDIAHILLKGKIPPELAARLNRYGFRGQALKEFQRLARGEMMVVGARRFKVSSYADLVARTKLRELHRVATIVRLQQNGIDHVQIDDHEQEEIDECTPFAGKVFYIGPFETDPAGFVALRDILNGGPPFHPNCQHVLLPWTISTKSKGTIDRARANSKSIPRSMMGKDNLEVRHQVAALTDTELEALTGG